MGGIADYSGGMVLQLPIREATLASMQRHGSRTLRVVSLGAEENDRAAGFEMPLEDFEAGGAAGDYASARTYFGRDPSRAWAAYAAGVFLVLMQERGVGFPEGARILISSNVPEGKGVSSSAAIEVAVMEAVASAFGVHIEPREKAILCQKVENLVVGAPCGVMDQMTAVCGEAGKLLALLCQPAELQGTVQIPESVGIWGLDSGARHSVQGADYGSVRVGAFMGYRMMADRAGLSVETVAEGEPVSVDDTLWGGCLANVTPSAFEAEYAGALSDRMSGRAFLDRFSGTTDRVTRVDPLEDYAVRVPTAHPIYEHFRVHTFGELLRADPGERPLSLLGELMYQSHASYSACGLGSDGTDLLVELVREAGPGSGLYGAKITGGGSGGTVAVLGRRDAGEAVRAVAERYEDMRGHRPTIFSGSSPGSAEVGTLTLRRTP